MRSQREGGGPHRLELALRAPPFPARGGLPHTCDGQPHQVIADAGDAQQISGDRFQLTRVIGRAACLEPCGIRARRGGVHAQVHHYGRRGAQVQSGGETPPTQVQAVHLRAAELAGGGRHVVAREDGGAGTPGVVYPEAGRVQPGRPVVAPVPFGHIGSQDGAVRRRKEVQQRKHPRRGGLFDLGGRHRGAPGEGLPEAHAFVGEEEEGTVAAEGSAQCRAHVAHAERRAAVSGTVGKPIVGIQQFVAEGIGQRAVEVVAAGTAVECHRGAGQAAGFRRGGGRLQVEFFQRFERNQAVQTAEGTHRGQRAAGGLDGKAPAADTRIGADAVHREGVAVGPLAVDGELAGFAARGGGDQGSRGQVEQTQQAMAVRGQPFDGVAPHGGAGGGVVRVEQGRGALHRDGLLDAAHGKGEIDAGGPRQLYTHAEADDGAEAILADRNLVDARFEGGDGVGAVGGGPGGAAKTGIFVDHAHVGPGDGGLGRIQDGAGQVRVALRRRRPQTRQEPQKRG